MLFDIDLSDVKPRPRRRLQTCGHSYTQPKRKLGLPEFDLTGWRPRSRRDVKIRGETHRPGEGIGVPPPGLEATYVNR